MSRRASVFARQNPGKRRVRFPDEVMFEESIKESDGDAIMRMLRRTSVDIDIDRINMAGMTALHQAILDNNLVVVRLLLHHGSRINKPDVDSWTPLHAAAANGHHQIAAYLLSKGADRTLLTDEGETALDLVDPEDTKMSELLTAERLTPSDLHTLQQFDMAYNERRMSGLGVNRTKPEPAWFRRESLVCESEQRLSVRGVQDGGVRLHVPERDNFSCLRARKGSMWVGGEGSRLVEEEEEEQQSNAETTQQSSAMKTQQTNAHKTHQINTQRTLHVNAQRTLQSNAQKTLQSNAQRAPKSNAQRTPQSNAQRTPQSNAQRTPQSNTQRAPHSNAQRTPHSTAPRSPHSNAQSSPHSSAMSSETIHISKREQQINSTEPTHIPKSRKNTFNEVEEEENVAEKLQKWKMRRGGLHVER